MSNFRASFIELFSRIIKVTDDKKDGKVYWNGENNLYPNEVERVVNNSATASRACAINGKYIAGAGLIDESKDVIVNVDKNYNLSNICAIAGHDMAEQGGVWFHVGYGISDDGSRLIAKSLDILDYTKCRKGREDDDNNDRKVFYKDFSEKKAMYGKAADTKWFYPFDKTQEVVIAQIKSDYKAKKGEETDDILEMLPHYRGQVYYLNLTPRFKYALAPVDSVFNDADSEFRISNYVNSSVREGFLGKTAVLTQGLYAEQANNVKDDISKWLGSENSSGIYHLDVAQADDLDKVLKIIQLNAQFDEKLFTETNKNLQTKILGAYDSIPELLVVSNSGTLFGTSGEAYIQAKKFYNEQTFDKRWRLSETLTYLGFPCEIKPIDDGNEVELSTGSEVLVIDDATKEAQAGLRGSVGGVQGVLGVQQSYAQGLTDYNSAITIFTAIYGFSQEVADALLGSPEKNIDDGTTATS